MKLGYVYVYVTFMCALEQKSKCGFVGPQSVVSQWPLTVVISVVCCIEWRKKRVWRCDKI